jgi:hypothetical protein
MRKRYARSQIAIIIGVEWTGVGEKGVREKNG